MPSPALLADRLKKAIVLGDEAAFRRWSSHPRFVPECAAAEDWALVALRRPDATAWLDRILDAGASFDTLSWSEPLICSAVGLGSAAGVAWCLAHGASPRRRLDFGMGPSAASMALRAQDPTMLVAMFQATGQVRQLLLPGEWAQWLAPEALPGLAALVEAGWDPEAVEPGLPESWMAWATAQPKLSAEVAAFLKARRLDRRLDAPAPSSAPPRQRM